MRLDELRIPSASVVGLCFGRPKTVHLEVRVNLPHDAKRRSASLRMRVNSDARRAVWPEDAWAGGSERANFTSRGFQLKLLSSRGVVVGRSPQHPWLDSFG